MRPSPHPASRPSRRSGPRPGPRAGFALVTTLMIVAVIGIMVAGSLALSVSNLRVTSNDATTSRALAAAQAGSAYWRAELVSLYAHMLDHWDDYGDDIEAYVRAGGQISCGNYLAIGVDVDRDGEPDVANGGTLPGVRVPMALSSAGTATGFAETTAKFSTRGSTIRLDVRAAGAGARARVVDEFSITSVDIWNNAVFAETSAANATIKGRATIRGAVHILGEGLDDDDIALDVTGSFGLGNTYEDLSSSLDVEEMNLTEPDPDDLCATLRVRSGRVEVGGSTNLGFPDDDPSDERRHYLRGIYANGNIRGGILESNVFSDNGMSAAYDAGDSYSFPYLDDPNPDTGRSWREELRDASLSLSTDDASQDDRNVLPRRKSDGTFDLPPGVPAPGEGDAYLSAGCAATMFGTSASGSWGGDFFLDGTAGWGGSADFSCTKYRVSGFAPDPARDEVLVHVAWERGEQRLTIGGTSGVVRLHGGDLTITGASGGNARLGYRGEGILFVEDEPGRHGGDIDLRIDFLPHDDEPVCADERGMPLESECPFGLANTYPATSLLGLVADDRITSSESQQRFTAAMYAESSIRVEKQTLVAGGIVTRTFDAGSNVPTVLYVPNLAERLSDLMPGAGGAGYAISNVAFSRR